MKSKLGIVCMSLGAVLLFGALFLLVRNQQEAQRAADFSDQVMLQMLENIYSEPQETEPAGEDGTGTAQEESQPDRDPYATEMTVKEIDGYGYIGFLSIPSLKLDLPVMADWDYTRLKLSPCRYTGSTKTDDLVIAAHNYGRHFGQLKELSEGDSVLFTDMDGMISQYEVVALDVLPPTAVEEVTAGIYDLILFTCTYGGKTRVAVYCDRVP